MHEKSRRTAGFLLGIPYIPELWRMVRDSNPRTGCPVNGFQDRRIRPLCQPSLTFLFPPVFQPTVLFAGRTWRCCSPLVRARLRNLLALLTRTQDRHYCPALPTIHELRLQSYGIFFQNANKIHIKNACLVVVFSFNIDMSQMGIWFGAVVGPR